VHIETPAIPEVPQLSLIVKLEPLEENILPQHLEDTETEALHEILDEPQPELE
jgi:hypothetical protein